MIIAAIIAITLPLVDIFIAIVAMLYLIIFCNGTFAC